MTTLPRSARLPLSVIGLYASFIMWGYLQERLSSTDYRMTLPATLEESKAEGQPPARWTFVFVLNCCMALTCFITSLPFVVLGIGGTSSASERTRKMILERLRPHSGLALPALSNALASPFGYLSLRYINYPMLLLVKSSKLVPVMLLSWLLNGKKYSIVQIASVALISLGVALFSCKVHPLSLILGFDIEQPKSFDSILRTSVGFTLVSINLFVDGFTNAQQDRFRDKNPNVSSFQMMYQINLWQFIFMSSYLSTEAILNEMRILPYSQLFSAVQCMLEFPSVGRDVVLFSLCGAIGQVFIFYIIASFGSLTCVLVTVTRKFFSILLSIIIFSHAVQWWQWVGVGAVFTGLMANTIDKFYSKKSVVKAKEE